MARQIEEDARRRGQALRDESRAVEERLKKAAQGLRRMTTEIDELLGAPAVDGRVAHGCAQAVLTTPGTGLGAPSDDR